MVEPHAIVPSFTELRNRVALAGQEHLLAFWAELSPEERGRLARDIAATDFELLRRLARGEGVWESGSLPLDKLSVPAVWKIGADGPGATREEATREGTRLLKEGKVACLVVAGGQGTRLGYPGPKGTLPFGPVSGKTLFEIHCAKIARLEKTHGATVPLVIMTSDANDADTRDFFAIHENFGLTEVRFMVQGSIPAIDGRGRLFLAAKDRIFRSPDGHGGTIRALATSGILDELIGRGFLHLFYFQVDNPIVKIAEPSFVGAHHRTDAEFSLKVLRKVSPGEKLGVLAQSEGTYFIIEYSDLPQEAAEARDDRGELAFWAGSPAIHVFSLAFFKRLIEEGTHLPYHRAAKKIPHIDERGNPVEPDRENGTKFETFIFDAMPIARRVLAVEGVREEEFAPVKNKKGQDSLESAQRMLSELHWGWLAGRGIAVPRAADGKIAAPCEIHPTFALGPEDIPQDVARRIPAGGGPVYLE